MLRIIAVSTRGPRYLVGNPNVHAIDKLPADVGTPFASLAHVQAYVRREFRGLTVYWRVEVVDTDGAVVWLGVRDGYNGAVGNWIWTAAQ